MRSDLPLALRLLRVVLAGVGGACLLACVLAMVVVIGDRSSHQDTWDGLAAGLAMLTIAAAAPVGLAGVMLILLVGSSPALGAKVALVTGGGLVLLPFLLRPALGSSSAWFTLVGLPVAVLAAIGLSGLDEPTD